MGSMVLDDLIWVCCKFFFFGWFLVILEGVC